KQATKVPPSTEDPASRLRAQLDAQVTFILDDPIPLHEALEYLSERYDIRILVDAKAFEREAQIMDVENRKVKLRRVNGVRLRSALRLICSQVNGDFLEQAGEVWVAPESRAKRLGAVGAKDDASTTSQATTGAVQKLLAEPVTLDDVGPRPLKKVLDYLG